MSQLIRVIHFADDIIIYLRSLDDGLPARSRRAPRAQRVTVADAVPDHRVTSGDADERYGVARDEDGRQEVDALDIRRGPRLLADKLMVLFATVPADKLAPLVGFGDVVDTVGDEVVLGESGGRRDRRDRVSGDDFLANGVAS